MKRFILGSLILPLLGTSVVAHANIFDDFFGDNRDRRDNNGRVRVEVRPRRDQNDRRRDDPWFQEDRTKIFPPAPKNPVKKSDDSEKVVGPNANWSAKAAPTALASLGDFYKAVGVAAVWTDANGRLNQQAVQLREVLRNAEEHGLISADYWTPAMEQTFVSYNASQAAQFEMTLTQAFIKFATHLSVGRVNPQAVGEEIKIKAKTVPAGDLAAILKNTTMSLRDAIETLAPKWMAYLNLQATLMILRQIDPAVDYPEVTVPQKVPAVGGKSPSLVNVKIRMRTLGYPITETSENFTREFEKIVDRYMGDHNISGNPDLNKGFWASITVPLANRIGQLTLTMEKLRWLKNQPEENHVEVNTAFSRLRVYEGRSMVLGMKTVNGRAARMTPMLQDRIVNVKLNPTWTVPVRLVLQDKVPLIRENPYYLEDHHFIVLDGSMQNQLSPYSIDWNNLTSSNAQSFYLQQQPGLGNALGVMKFNLTNDEAIYLHDTNERELFRKFYRQLSSGCVRLENPVALATYLLKNDPKWGTPEALNAGMANTQWSVDTYPPVKDENIIELKKSMPVYLMNLTVEIDESGIMKFGGDFYGQDNRLFQVLKATSGR